jgi:hypothetical protein
VQADSLLTVIRQLLDPNAIFKLKNSSDEQKSSANLQQKLKGCIIPIVTFYKKDDGWRCQSCRWHC